MPETREAAAAALIAAIGLSMAQALSADLRVQQIVCDASQVEAEAFGATERARQGLPYVLEPTSTLVRGSLNHQAPVYPQFLIPPSDSYPPTPYPPTLKSLVLCGVQSTHRALILNLGTSFLMIQFLTHTSVQWYPRERWESGVMSVSKDVRKFHVGMALVFADFVLAFVTIDLLFQPTWANTIADFSIPPNIYTSPTEFLSLVATWIEDQNFLAGRKYKLACDAIRDAGEVWYGIGVYTVMELFFMAGLSPFLTVGELFCNPSRTARFLAAFYTYIDNGESNLRYLVGPCIHEGVLAPTTEQRLRYADWLYVWGKDRVRMSSRMSELVDAFHAKLDEFSSHTSVTCRDTVEDLYDVFEPTLVATALHHLPNFAPLIFGETTWLAMGGLASTSDDPLTAFYRRNDLLHIPTKLAPNFYNPAILPDSALKTAHRTTLTYHGHKEMWSVTQNFPPTLHWSSKSNQQARAANVHEITGQLRHKMLFKSIVQTTQGVSIGPLEYCGNGHIAYVGNIPWLAVCKGDPTIPQYFEERMLRGLNRITTKMNGPGKRKRARTNKENTVLAAKLTSIKDGYLRAGTLVDSEVIGSDNDPPQSKKRRLSTDQRLALQSI
ncbi:hypothetical protein DFH06DRAFT_1041932 [Mycena polygramma]|nr:hypothetical protein DFH06DRAFT_1041932 [Mycena polygramma]